MPKLDAMLRAAATVVVVVGFASLASEAAVEPLLVPDRGSPLAADGQWLYSVTDGGRALICRPLARGSRWRYLKSPPFNQVTGLAAAANALFVADGATKTITRLTPGSSSTTAVPTPGIDVADIAYAGALFAADSRTGRIVRVAEDGSSLPATLPGVSAAGRVYLGSDGTNLVVSYPDKGDIHYIADPARAQPIARVAYSRDAAKVITKKDTLQEVAYPRIKRPGRLSVYRGILYVVDETDGAMYALSRNPPARPVRCVLQLSGKPPAPVAVANMFAHGAALTVLLADGREEDWPRIVPVALVLKATNQSDALAQVYTYLFRTGILPTRTIPGADDLETTLRDSGVFANPTNPATGQLLCILNRGTCAGGVVRLTRGQPIVVPDLTFERYVRLVEATGATLDDAVTTADREIRTADFKSVWVDKEALRDHNPEQKEGPEAAQNPKTFLTFVEFVRYLAPMASEDVPTAKGGNEALQTLRKQKIIDFVSFEENPSAAPANNGGGVPLTAPWDGLQRNFDRVIKAISHVEAPAHRRLFTPGIGVAEADVLPDHPDFCVGGACAFAPIEGGVPEGRPRQANVEPVVKPQMDDTDHGTMVASAIGARKNRFGRKGFAPDATLHYINSANGQIGIGVNDAAMAEVRVFNLSVSYKDATPNDLVDLLAISKYLFVVAAGKHKLAQSGEICTAAVKPYPACEASRSNMIVVTSTDLDGTHLVPATADLDGANFGERVDVAAPGQGFHLAARPDTYAPADGGSSFAVPLVTATAATLYSQGIYDPAAIRERIIATAEPRPDWRIKGGLLNVRRAVLDTQFGVIDGRKCRRPLRDAITFKQVVGPPLHLTMNQILRLHPFGPHMRLVYVEGGQLQIENDVYFESADHSKFTCIDETGVATTEFLGGTLDYVGPVRKVD